jgi:hypothetical protein
MYNETADYFSINKRILISKLTAKNPLLDRRGGSRPSEASVWRPLL